MNQKAQQQTAVMIIIVWMMPGREVERRRETAHLCWVLWALAEDLRGRREPRRL